MKSVLIALTILCLTGSVVLAGQGAEVYAYKSIEEDSVSEVNGWVVIEYEITGWKNSTLSQALSSEQILTIFLKLL
jgi:hypothetical protein